MATCVRCGSIIPAGAGVCPVCGTQTLGAPTYGIGGAPGGAVPPGAAAPGAPPSLPVPAAGSLAAAQLITRAQQAFAVSDGMVLGRDPACTLVLNSPDGSISRQHAVINLTTSGWVIRDLNSTNGTFVNGQQVLGAAVLCHLDIVRLGTVFELALYDPAHPRAASSTPLGPTTVMRLPPGSAQAGGGAPAGGIAQPSIPLPPGVQRYAWRTPPHADGIVTAMRGPFAVDAGGRVGKVVASIGLALIFPPLAFIPWMSAPAQIQITTLRVQNFDDGRQVAVTLMGDLRAQIEDGEAIAVWGRADQGTLYAIDLYIYATDNWLRFRR